MENKITTTAQQELFNKLDDREAILGFVKKEADDKAERALAKKAFFRKERIELTGGGHTSIEEEQEAYKKFIAENEYDYDPQYREYIPTFNKLMGWSEEITRRFSKPKVAPDTINQCIYDRFGKGFLNYVGVKNKFVKHSMRRRTKHYKLLNHEGIMKLAGFIEDAVGLMNKSKNYYEFRMKHSELFGTHFQPELFKEYI
ncbi:P63C domain-containing protein [Mucilaginibacter frigoritolerans]|uniref:P63C domain-containing protein n=1 Tax=Mucilaginibacter frigoritolerans TaxID=652788 RepID=A0A562UHX7_9SPHI|nr:P63C domain-containing protein [Mucilaginibacter frigoritolerans]TWJ04791.1 P63C domain-containing protein [Mucilaginibacter frigoritolerans]